MDERTAKHIEQQEVHGRKRSRVDPLVDEPKKAVSEEIPGEEVFLPDGDALLDEMMDASIAPEVIVDIEVDPERSKRRRNDEEDEEGRQRGVKFQVHEKEIDNFDNDVAVSSVGSIWICSIAFNQAQNVVKQHLIQEMKQVNDFWDDVSGRSLNPDLVIRARNEEIAVARKMTVYDKVPLQEC